MKHWLAAAAVLVGGCATHTSPAVTVHGPQGDPYLAAEQAGPSVPRIAQLGTIQIIMEGRSSDPGRTRIRNVLIRRNGPQSSDMDFCGEVYRANDNGLIDSVQIFYGSWIDGRASVLTGNMAGRMCQQKVFH